MVSFTPRLNIVGTRWGEYAHAYYWGSANIYAGNKDWCMANCTCYAYGRVLEIGSPAPVDIERSAYRWNSHMINGWYAIPYSKANVEPGDLLQWGDYYLGIEYPNHVAFVETVENDVITTTNSNWTARPTSLSFAEISDYFQTDIDNRQWRFWNSFEGGENYIRGYEPLYILKNPGNPGPGPGPTPTPGESVQYPIAIGNKWGLQIGDRVKIIGTGRAATDGSGNIAYGLGWTRYIQDIYENGAYPFRVGYKNGKETTGFYKADALEKLPPLTRNRKK